jgi:hypothetical protein
MKRSSNLLGNVILPSISVLLLCTRIRSTHLYIMIISHTLAKDINAYFGFPCVLLQATRLLASNKASVIPFTLLMFLPRKLVFSILIDYKQMRCIHFYGLLVVCLYSEVQLHYNMQAIQFIRAFHFTASVVRDPGYRCRLPGFDSRRYQIF